MNIEAHIVQKSDLKRHLTDKEIGEILSAQSQKRDRDATWFHGKNQNGNGNRDSRSDSSSSNGSVTYAGGSLYFLLFYFSSVLIFCKIKLKFCSFAIKGQSLFPSVFSKTAAFQNIQFPSKLKVKKHPCHKLTEYHRWDSIFMINIISSQKLGGIELWSIL